MLNKVINSNLAPDPIGPYNHSIKAGDLLFVSGQIGYDKSKEELILHNIEEETRQVMKNIEFILNEAHCGFRNVVKTTIFLKDMKNYGKVNEVYAIYFGENAPARECVEVSKLPKDVNVEISVIASVG